MNLKKNKFASTAICNDGIENIKVKYKVLNVNVIDGFPSIPLLTHISLENINHFLLHSGQKLDLPYKKNQAGQVIPCFALSSYRTQI